MSKVVKETDWTDKVLPIGVLGITAFVLIYGFFFSQPCDIDKQYLYCKLHPASGLRIFGLFVFVLSSLLVSGVWKKWFKLYNAEHTVTWNIISFVGWVLGMLIVWFL